MFRSIDLPGAIINLAKRFLPDVKDNFLGRFILEYPLP
jgi:hypothetical protein